MIKTAPVALLYHGTVTFLKPLVFLVSPVPILYNGCCLTALFEQFLSVVGSELALNTYSSLSHFLVVHVLWRE